MAKCKYCPCRRTCRDECYGDNPCEFATAFDKLGTKLRNKDRKIARLKEEVAAAREDSLSRYMPAEPAGAP